MMAVGCADSPDVVSCIIDNSKGTQVKDVSKIQRTKLRGPGLHN